MTKFTSLKSVLLLAISVFAVPDDGSVTHDGTITYYDDGLLGHCSYPLSERPVYHGAINTTDYDGSSPCGAYVRVTGSLGSVDVLIDNECPVGSNPKCVKGHIDLSPEAFAKVAKPIDGYVDVTWNYIEAPITGPVVFQFKNGVNQWHLEVVVRNHRYAITKLEIKDDSDNWVNMDRQEYNYFKLASGMGRGPFTFRVTDIHGQQIVNNDVPMDLKNQLAKVTSVSGSEQFPVWEEGSNGNGETTSLQLKTLKTGSTPGGWMIESSESLISKVLVFDLRGNLLDLNEDLSVNHFELNSSKFKMNHWLLVRVKLDSGIWHTEKWLSK